MSDIAPHLTLDEATRALTTMLARGGRVLLVGASGTGKSTLARAACESLDAGAATYLCADPGRPAFGPPGALTRARYMGKARGWEIAQLEGLATMDCARFRAPLLAAISRQLGRCETPACVIDAPGMTRGLGAIELLAGMIQILGCDHVLLLQHAREGAPSFLPALRATGCAISTVQASEQARRPSDRRRFDDRASAWKAHLGADAHVVTIARDAIQSTGALPMEGAWPGHIVALRDQAGDTIAMGKIVDATPLRFIIETRQEIDADMIAALLVRDLGFEKDRIRTLRPPPSHDKEPLSEVDSPTQGAATAYTQRSKPNIRLNLGEGPVKQGGSIKTTIVGNLFEDPMIVLRLDHRQRCLFFDLGEVRQVPTRIVHQTTDIFITHAHLDHFGDFPWLLRRMVGSTTPMRLYGPPNITERVENMVHAFTWDRVEDRGPRFEVLELRGDTLHRSLVQAGIDGRKELEPRQVQGGYILDEPRLRVRAVEVDHGCPVIAYSVEEPNKFDVRGNILKERGWKPGRWLGELKTRAAMRELTAMITIDTVDGEQVEVSVGDLMEMLLIASPGQKIVYATDFGYTPENRAKIIDLASEADVLICESSFEEGDRDQAERTGHLCAKDCAELARDARVNLLVPFHLSVRYEHDPTHIYRQILDVFERVHVPQPIFEVLCSTTPPT